MTRPTTTGKAQDLITFTRSTTGTYLDSVTYGDELVTNGTFDTDSDWTVSSAWDISAGVATATNADGSYSTSSLRQSLSLELGKLYKVSVDASSITGQVRLYQGLFSSGLQVTGAGVVTGFLTGEGAGNLNLLATAGSSAVIDSVSVKEVIGGQGTQGTPLLRTSAINEARIEYDASGNCLGLLVEEARTNLFRYSQELSNVDHFLITTDNATVSPDGTQNASLCIPTSANVEHFIDDQTVTVGTDYAMSCFAKYGSGSYLLAFRGSAIGANSPRFDLQTGTVVNEGASSVWSNTKIEDVGNGWYKCSSVGNPNATSPLRFQLMRSDGATTFTGDGTGHYIWGIQIEQNSFPTSYIPTSGSTVTRSADVASLAVSEFGYNQDQGSVVLEAVMPPSVISEQFWILGSNTNSARWAFSNITSPNVNAYDGASIFTVSSLQPSATQKMAIGTDQSTAIMCLDGVSGNQANTNGNISSLTTVFYFGGNNGGPPYLNGHIKSIQYYPLRLSNAQLQALTV